jgi:2-isopropylmalate synthase
LTLNSSTFFTHGNDSDLIYDWNSVEGPELEPQAPRRLNDETLRDGLQSPSVLDPPIGKKIHILLLMDELGIDQVNLGLPGAGPRAKEDVPCLAREITASKLRLRANCAARTVESDIWPFSRSLPKEFASSGEGSGVPGFWE